MAEIPRRFRVERERERGGVVPAPGRFDPPPGQPLARAPHPHRRDDQPEHRVGLGRRRFPASALGQRGRQHAASDQRGGIERVVSGLGHAQRPERGLAERRRVGWVDGGSAERAGALADHRPDGAEAGARERVAQDAQGRAAVVGD